MLLRRISVVRSALVALSLSLPALAADWVIYPSLIERNFTDALIEPGERFEASLPLENRSAEAREAVVRVRLLDLWENPVGEPAEHRVSLAAGGRTSLDLAYAPERPGMYKIEVTVGAPDAPAEDARLRDVTSFAVFPAGPITDHPFFGTHSVATGELPVLARRLGFKMNRVHNMTQFTWWTRLQPEPGDWLPESRTNRDYDALLDHGFELYGQWYGTPWWATDDATAKRPERADAYPFRWVPRFDDALREYIRESLRRFPAIKEWEVWNEPWVTSHFWSGSPEQYAELCKLIYAEAKSLRPDITVLAMLRADSPWVERALKAGVLEHTDHLAFHGLRLRDDDHPRHARGYVRRLKEQIAPYRTVPLVFSEPKLNTTTFLRGLDVETVNDERRARPVRGELGARASVQYRVAMMAEGVRSTYTYQHNAQRIHPRIDPTFNYHTTEIIRTPKPELVASGVLVHMLDGGAFVRELRLAPGVPAFVFSRNDGGSLAVLWAEDGARLALRAGLPAYDVLAGPLDEPAEGLVIDAEVRYLRHDGPPEELLARLKAVERTVLAKPSEVFDENTPADPMWMDEL